MKPSMVLMLLVASCSSELPAKIAPGCSALVGDDCLSPFPSSLYETPDSTAATGVRVAIPAGVLPVEASGAPLSADRLNGRDGFSPSTPFIVYFKAGVGASQLAPLDQLAQSVTAQSPVQ